MLTMNRFSFVLVGVWIFGFVLALLLINYFYLNMMPETALLGSAFCLMSYTIVTYIAWVMIE